MSNDGYTLSWRRKWSNPVFRNLRDAGIWAWLCDSAAWRDTTVRYLDRMVTLGRGQLVTSERFIAEGFCIGRQVVRRLLDDLESAQMITRASTHGGTIITICKYDTYQHHETGDNPAGSPPGNPGPTHVQPTPNPNKKEPKELKELEVDAPASPAPTPELSADPGQLLPEPRPAKAAKLPRDQRATRLPADWQLPAEWRAAAAAARARGGLPPVNLELEAVKFANYWHGASGRNATKLDWAATWQNWALNARPAPNGHAGVAPAPASAPSVDPWIARIERFKADRTWQANQWGPAPDQPGCKAPRELTVRILGPPELPLAPTAPRPPAPGLPPP